MTAHYITVRLYGIVRKSFSPSSPDPMDGKVDNVWEVTLLLEASDLFTWQACIVKEERQLWEKYEGSFCWQLTVSWLQSSVSPLYKGKYLAPINFKYQQPQMKHALVLSPYFSGSAESSNGSRPVIGHGDVMPANHWKGSRECTASSRMQSSSHSRQCRCSTGSGSCSWYENSTVFYPLKIKNTCMESIAHR